MNIREKKMVSFVSSGNEVRNIEIAACKHCDKKGYALILHKNDELEDINGF